MITPHPNNHPIIMDNVSITTDEGKQLLTPCSYHWMPNTTYALTGPNGSGKSTLTKAFFGLLDDSLQQTGTITWGSHLLHTMPTEQRVDKGLFLASQHVVEIPEISCLFFLKSMEERYRKKHKMGPTPKDFLDLIHSNADALSLPKEHLQRGVHHGFSGGEKKKFEILQMLCSRAPVCILDEVDAGLDHKALSAIAHHIRQERQRRTFVIISHNTTFLDDINPHIRLRMHHGTLQQSTQNTQDSLDNTKQI